MAKNDSEGARFSNRDRIVRLLRIHGRMARIDLARLVGLSPATVSALSAELIRQGLVREVDGLEPDRARGRPKVMIELVARTACIVAVKLSINEVRVALGDFAGGVGETEIIALDSRALDADGLVRVVGDAIADFRARHAQGYGPCLGIGLAVQGLVRGAEILVWSPALAVREVNIVRPLAMRFGLPVVMMNDANAIAAAVRNRVGLQSVDNLAVVMLGSGVGMGLILGGRMYDGSTGAAAEFGHSKFQTDGPLCMCGKRGCIESYIADYAIHRDARTILGLGASSVQHPTEAEMMAINALADTGDSRAIALFEQAGRVLGYGLGNLIALISPDLILVTGPGVRAWRYFEPGMRQGLTDAVVETLLVNTRIEPLPWEEDLAFRGVVGQVLDRVPAP
jgi:predicted NBD/HSP70 family sugar kinase